MCMLIILLEILRCSEGYSIHPNVNLFLEFTYPKYCLYFKLSYENEIF